jgi:hypothetical protein
VQLPTVPVAVRDELNAFLRRLTAVRSPKDAIAALDDSTDRLLEISVPVLAQHPLPVHGRRRAEMTAAFAGGAGALVAELDEIAVVFTDGIAAPVIVAADVAARGVEGWVAVSLRVHQLRRAGRDVDPAVLSNEVKAAILGVDMQTVKHLAKNAAKRVARRIARRWAVGLAPAVGVAINGAAARRTIRAIARLPLDDHPLTSSAAHLAPEVPRG